MNRKIIFFDIDGTIYSHELGCITQRVTNAIAKTREKGHLCFIASGRPYGFIAENVKEIGFDGYVLANGANIKYNEQDLEIRYLKYEDVKEMCYLLKKKNIEYVLQTSDLCYIDKNNECLLDFYKHCNIDFKNFCYDYHEDEIMHKVIKMEAWGRDEEELQYAKICCHKFSCEIHDEFHTIEIYDKNVSKATGILDVCKLLDMNVEDSYCFGDGPNDVEMFDTVGHPIAMGNAIDIIKEKAEDICLSVCEDGVANKLEELFIK